ncbi:MAG: FeoB-associated Cys-rich membrane protein [Synergistaceae bacterium]|jgi:hypothetical protein|nr:FeoB-associated Cys-rich membrane protein [Synergistaceae bacterium]
MNLADAVLAVLAAALVALAVFSLFRGKKRGCCRDGAACEKCGRNAPK